MADNLVTQSSTLATPAAATRFITLEGTFSGESGHAGLAILGTSSGAEGSRTFTDVSTSNPLPISDAGGSVTIDGSVTVTGVATEASQTTIIGHLDGVEALIGTTNTTLSTIDGRVDGLEGVLGTTADASPAVGAVGSLSAKLRLMTTQLDAIQTAVQLLDNTVAGNELQVDIVSGGLTITRPATATLANVATSTTSATLQASNASRLGWTCYNDSTSSVLYIKYGTTASATSFTVRLDPGGQYVDPTGYTGRIDGILASGTGTARVTELTA
jgi:hypothetical protein